jgi:hypothetical protein
MENIVIVFGYLDDHDNPPQRFWQQFDSVEEAKKFISENDMVWNNGFRLELNGFIEGKCVFP